MRRRPAGPRNGFSLLEVVLATAIFVGSVAVISQLIDLGLFAADSNKLATIAQLRAESITEEIVAGIRPLVPLDEPVPFHDDLAWQWTLQMEPSPLEGLLTLHVRVERLDEAGGPIAEHQLSRLLIDPDLFAPAETEPADERRPITVREMLGLPAGGAEGPAR